MTVTSAQIIAASSDGDLQRRLRAIASSMGIENPQGWVESHLDELAAAPVDDEGNTVGSVYEYASAVYDDEVKSLPPRPGENPAAVTDDYLRYAIDTVKSA